MSDFRLPTPLARVRMSDGRVLEARIINPDYLMWDRTASRHNWPSAQQGPFLWQTFLAWAALKRTQQIDATWEEFSDRLAEQVELEGFGATEAESNGVDPTLAAVGPG